MNSTTPAQPSLHASRPTGQAPVARLRGSILLALGFAFTGAALLGAPEKEAAAPVTRATPAAGGYAAAPASAPAAYLADSPEVSAAVRDWVWETPSAVTSRASEHYDFEELWMPR